MMVVPLSRPPRDYLVFFRKEVARSVDWAGDPNKPVVTGPLGDRLTPRKSFELWKENVRGQSLPWTPVECRIAESLRVSLLEVILRLTDLTEIERQRAQERQELLIAELNHRVRNILGLIRGVISQSKDSADVGRVLHQHRRRPHPGAGARARSDHRRQLGAGVAAQSHRRGSRRLSWRQGRPRADRRPGDSCRAGRLHHRCARHPRADHQLRQVRRAERQPRQRRDRSRDRIPQAWCCAGPRKADRR